MNVNKEQLIQNLKDAGCDDATIQVFLDNLSKGCDACGIHLLERHRSTLLNTLHSEQKKIDCLDYLIYTLRKRDPQRV